MGWDLTMMEFISKQFSKNMGGVALVIIVMVS